MLRELSKPQPNYCQVNQTIATLSAIYDAIRAKSKFTLIGPCNGGAMDGYSPKIKYFACPVLSQQIEFKS